MTEAEYYENEENIDENEAIGYYQDPIARETSWRPLVKGGANFKTKKLVLVNPNRLEFKATIQIIIFGLVFLILGLIVTVTIGREAFIGIGIGLLFVAAGCGMLYYTSIPVVIDKSLGYFWHSKKEPSGYNKQDDNKYTKLEDIHAIQIVSERVEAARRSGNSNRRAHYTSYEINFILKDTSRKNVVDHGNLTSITKDAKTLANFLNVPLWNQLEQLDQEN